MTRRSKVNNHDATAHVLSVDSLLRASADEEGRKETVTDHQGNIRAVTDGSGTVLRTNHYDPYGEEVLPVLTSASTLPTSTAGTDAASRYMYGAKEWDNSVSLYDFSARWYNPASAVSFTTMDPLCEKYYGISPYAYCAGNPVNLVDPNGAIILIYDNLSNSNIKYSNGSLFYSDGREYDGNNSFVYLIRSTLNTLKSLNDDYVSGVISELETSIRTHTFVFDSKYVESVTPKGEYGHSLADDGTPVDTWILLSLNRTEVDGVKYTIETAVAHEISHSFDYDKGRLKGEDPWKGEGISPSEINAVNFENRVRARLGLPLRRNYHIAIPQNKLENPYIKKNLK